MGDLGPAVSGSVPWTDGRQDGGVAGGAGARALATRWLSQRSHSTYPAVATEGTRRSPV